LVPVSLSKDQKSPFATSGTDIHVVPIIIVLTLIIRWGRVDGSWFKTKTENFSFNYDNTSTKTVVMATAIKKDNS